MAGTMLQPSHEPPRTRDKKQAPVTLKIQCKKEKNKTKKGKGAGGELDDDCSRPRWLKKLHALYDLPVCHYCVFLCFQYCIDAYQL